MTEYYIYLHSMVIGFMALFVIVIAPSIFQSLEPTDAGTLLRRLFPRMFLYGMVLTLAAAGMAILGAQYILALVSLVSAAGFGINAYIIAPSINKARDELENDEKCPQKNSLGYIPPQFRFLRLSFLPLLSA